MLIENDTDMLCRFIFQDSHCNPTTKKLHWRAFEPRPNPANGRKEVSVFLSTQLTKEQRDALGKNHVARLQGREVKSQINFAVEVTKALNLTVEMDIQPHDLHANLVGWPKAEDDELAKCHEIVRDIKAHVRTSMSKIE